jgi:peptidoglycan/xylan/chitin deacetylase (PgdA/CDA1 family)
VKIQLRLFYLVLFPVFLLYACASRPSQTADKLKNPALNSLPPQEGLIPDFNQTLEKIKRNGKDIDKYYVVDGKGRIIVKADLRDQGWDFEVVYDLENVRDIGNSVYEIDFTCQEKKTRETMKDFLIWSPSASRAGLLLSFDDDYLVSWERNFDLFDKYNAKVTFFIIGKPDSFCARAIRKGHDVGYHSLSHKDLRKLSRDKFNSETIGGARAFRAAGYPVTSFAYPYGLSQPWMHEVLLGSFGTLRGFVKSFNLYSEDEIRRHFILSRSIDNTIIPSDEEFYRTVNIMLRTVKFIDKDQILPLTSHIVSEKAPWGISARRLEYLLKTAKGLGLVFYRYSDFSIN